MAKYSYEFKKTIVQEYLSGKGSYEYLGEKYSIRWEYVRRWVRNYNANGADGLLRSRKQRKYSFEYKLHVVELYLSN
ncbi:MAG: helix-turn-helix domain-containing protein, partial [Lachnospiraceae bacterium]|nr:helix-turn-helix domain-containing protein [Lachnospiraceae bacterium]